MLEAVDLRTEFHWLYLEARDCIRFGEGYHGFMRHAGEADEEILRTLYNMAYNDLRRGR